MRLGDSPRLDTAVYMYVWFKQKRTDGIPVSGPMLCEKAIDLSKRMFGEDAKFNASDGWKWRFCRTHGIRNEQDSEDEGEEEGNPMVSNGVAAHKFEQCLAWLEHQPEANAYNTSVLRQLHTLAARKRIQSLKQTQLDNFSFPISLLLTALSECANSCSLFHLRYHFSYLHISLSEPFFKLMVHWGSDK